MISQDQAALTCLQVNQPLSDTLKQTFSLPPLVHSKDDIRPIKCLIRKSSRQREILNIGHRDENGLTFTLIAVVDVKNK